MTRRPQQRLPAHQTALSDRCRLAPDADETWRPDANWREWTDWLQPATGEVYRLLRHAAQGQRRFNSMLALAEKVGVWHPTLRTILDELDALEFIRLQRNRRGTITGVEVSDPPPVPDNMPDALRGLAYNCPPPPAPAEVRRWISYWCGRWKDIRGVDYEVLARDRPLVRSMLATFGFDKLKRMAYWVLADPHHEVEDDVIRRSDLSIGTFHARINQIAPAWQKAEARRSREERKDYLAGLPYDERRRIERQEQQALLEKHKRRSKS